MMWPSGHWRLAASARPGTGCPGPAGSAAGHAAVYRGQIDGDRLIFESMEDAGIRLGFTWDASDPGVITWRNEMTTGDALWFLIEEYPMVPQ